MMSWRISRRGLRRALRYWKWPAIVILALNIETLAAKLGIDSLLADHWDASVDRLLAIIQSAWLQIPALLIVGAAVALWLDATLRKRETDAAPVTPSQDTPNNEDNASDHEDVPQGMPTSSLRTRLRICKDSSYSSVYAVEKINIHTFDVFYSGQSYNLLGEKDYSVTVMGASALGTPQYTIIAVFENDPNATDVKCWASGATPSFEVRTLNEKVMIGTLSGNFDSGEISLDFI